MTGGRNSIVPRILYLSPGRVPPSRDDHKSKFWHLSEIAEGHVLLPVWWRGPDDVKTHLGPTAFPEFTDRCFRYHFAFCPPGLSKPIQLYRRLVFYLREALRIHRDGGIDIIMTYGASFTGLCGLILKYLTKAKLVIEVPGVPEVGDLFDAPTPSFLARARHKLFELLFVFTVKHADRAKLLYPTQLDAYPSLRNVPRTVFHEFVPVETIRPYEGASEPHILFVGYPWYRKGVDVLIRAFMQVADDYPDFTLRLLGWMPERKELEILAAGSPQIQFLKPVSHSEALKLISRCNVLVLPSRSEAMGRVLLEAMAARRPIIASAVDGIPQYIEDGFNGLLFESENADDLAAKLRKLLSDPGLGERLAWNGYRHVHEKLDERAFVRASQALVDQLLVHTRLPSDGATAE